MKLCCCGYDSLLPPPSHVIAMATGVRAITLSSHLLCYQNSNAALRPGPPPSHHVSPPLPRAPSKPAGVREKEGERLETKKNERKTNQILREREELSIVICYFSNITLQEENIYKIKLLIKKLKETFFLAPYTYSRLITTPTSCHSGPTPLVFCLPRNATSMCTRVPTPFT